MPVAFTFQSDKRLESRKTSRLDPKDIESAAKSTSTHANPEPQRAKREVKPPPPGPVFRTELRAKERKRFEEMVRTKEVEMEQKRAEERRKREEEEEREVSELRRKAIPRAHEVPDWYAEVPKKKDSKFSSTASRP